MQQERKSQTLRFGVFEANILARELRKYGTHVRLRGQPFCILAMLLERPGEVVTRDEMQKKLWPADTFVDFEHSLNSAIKKLRAVLGRFSRQFPVYRNDSPCGLPFHCPSPGVIPDRIIDT
jgi:DNA-binding winged helix-turn-helix (wHTH) protein